MSDALHDTEPETAPYVTTCWWYPHEPSEWEIARGAPGYQPDPTVHEHLDLAEAVHQGRRWGCMNGVCRVEVRSPDGELQAVWDKESLVVNKRRMYLDGRGRMLYDTSYVRNRWSNVGAEAKALHQRETDEIIATRRAVQAAHDERRTPGSPRRTATSQEVVDHLRRARTATPEGRTR